MKKKYLYWIPSLICMIVIFNFSAEPSTVSDNTSGNIGKTVLEIFYKNFDTLSSSDQLLLVESIQFYIRKMAHFTIYATLGICTQFGIYWYNISCKKKLIISLTICLIYSISDEIHQLFVPGRSGQLSDVCLDFSGAIFGTILFLLCLKIIKKIKTISILSNEID